MIDLYLQSCLEQAELLTKRYSTSFSKGTSLMDPGIRPAIYAIYGMVRVADDIVDTPRAHINPEADLAAFRKELWAAVKAGYSHNPILHGFQWVVNTYHLEYGPINAFLDSMATDLVRKTHDRSSYDRYVYGSAEAVGLMCLSVFCGDRYDELSPGARTLGSVFQKVNFLRDIAADAHDLGRSYFPGVKTGKITDVQKREIEAEIEKEFVAALPYIKELPTSAQQGVLLTYKVYYELNRRIERISAAELMSKRMSAPKWKKQVIYWKLRMFRA